MGLRSKKNPKKQVKCHSRAFCLRLSSIDTKYHVWKMGVVFTDNVSWNRSVEPEVV